MSGRKGTHQRREATGIAPGQELTPWGGGGTGGVAMGPGDRAPPTYNVRHTIFFQSIQSPGIEEPQNQPEPPAPVRLAIAVCRALGTVTQKVLTLIKTHRMEFWWEQDLRRNCIQDTTVSCI
jgi:hypothetical protein